jgi:hypothetical protein
VWARAYFNGLSLLGQIGCTVSGVETVWQSNIPLTWSTQMTMKCGVDDNPRSYQVYSGAVLVTSYNEGFTNLAAFPATGVSGRLYVANNTELRYTWNGSAYVSSTTAASSLGAAYRRFGAIVVVKSGKTSGTISSVAVSDSAPVIYGGSVARMSRLSESTVTFGTAENQLPATFFDTPEYESLDVDASIADGTFTVRESKMYMVTARIRLSSFFTSMCYVSLQRYNAATSTWSTTQDGDSIWPYDAFHNVQATNYALTGTWLQYLNAGDKVRLETWRQNGSSSVLTGQQYGQETYFSIAGLG